MNLFGLLSVLYVLAFLANAFTFEEGSENTLGLVPGKRIPKPLITTTTRQINKKTTEELLPWVPETTVDSETDSASSEPSTRKPETTQTFAATLPTTTPSPVCPPGESAITKNDLWTLIVDEAHHYEKELLSLNETLYNEAKEVYDKYMISFNDYVNKVLDKPTHLEHVLKYVTERREKLKPHIANVNMVLNENTDVFDNLNELEVKMQKLQKNYGVCEIVCGNCHLRSLPVRTTDLNDSSVPQCITESPEIYCGKISDIRRKISKSIELNLNHIEEETRELIKNNNEKIGKDLKIFENTFSELAVKEFGWIMYDVLSLLDEYDHLKEDVDIYISKKLQDDKEKILLLQNHIEDTQQRIQRALLKCAGCQRINYWTLQQSSDDEDDRLCPQKDLLEKLLENVSAATVVSVKEPLVALFKNIENTLAEGPTKYVNELKRVKLVVSEMVKKEYNLSEEIKISIPSEKLAELGTIPDSIMKMKTEVDVINEKLTNLPTYFMYKNKT